MIKKILFKELIIKWLKNHKLLVKESTFASYSVIAYNYLIPSFGMYEVSKIDNKVIQKCVLNWLKEGKLNTHGGLCEKSVKNIICVLKICMKYAVEMGYSKLNNIMIVYPKECKNNKIKVLPKITQKRLLDYIYNNLERKNLGILLALNTGIRIGELCAIQSKDIDIENKLIYITKTIQRVFIRENDGRTHTKVLITSPKTSTSIREIPLSDDMINILKKFKMRSKETYLLTGTKKHMEPRTYRSYYDNFLKKVNIEHINFHALRHTFATRCIQAGGDYKTVSELLGHATVNMTLNLYVHPQIEEKRKCIELLNAK